jgi:hypothetical protein
MRNVPYIIKSYEDTLKNPKDTIEFDHESDKKSAWKKNNQERTELCYGIKMATSIR